MTTKRKLNIFNVLSHLDEKDANYYDRLTEEEQKAFVPLITMKWLSGVSEARQIYFINELVNPHVFTSYTHPKLLFYLMSICGSGKAKRHFWNKTLSRKTSNMPTVVKVIREYFGYSTIEALDALPLLSDDNILSYAEDSGYQKEDITKIKKELNGRK